MQRAAEEEEHCMCSSTREGAPGMRASVGARDARRDVEKVQRNGGGGRIQRELTAPRVYWGALEGEERAQGPCRSCRMDATSHPRAHHHLHIHMHKALGDTSR